VWGWQRDTNDFELAYRKLLPRALRVAYQVLGDMTDAEDAAVEALARAALRWRYLAGLPEPRREAWVLRVTRNVAYDELRRRIRRQRTRPPDRPPYEPGADERVGHWDWTVRALSGLPKRQREVLTLRYIGGLSEAEIAAALNVTRGTVKTSAHRGLAELRRHLATNRTDDDAVS
jgi:RNA polymerase sigma factor (sigma-70 family)